jgi:hypothetical protein
MTTQITTDLNRATYTERLISWAFTPSATSSKVINAVSPFFKGFLFFVGCCTVILPIVVIYLDHTRFTPITTVPTKEPEKTVPKEETKELEKPPVQEVVPPIIETTPKNDLSNDPFIQEIQRKIAGLYTPPPEVTPRVIETPMEPLPTKKIMALAIGFFLVSTICAYSDEIADVISLFTTPDKYYRKLS